MARLEAQGVETRGDLDRVLTEQAEVLIQVRDVGLVEVVVVGISGMFGVSSAVI